MNDKREKTKTAMSKDDGLAITPEVVEEDICLHEKYRTTEELEQKGFDFTFRLHFLMARRCIDCGKNIQHLLLIPKNIGLPFSGDRHKTKERQ